MSFYQSSSQSSCLTAVSDSAESSCSQVLHLLSISVVTFISKMAAAPQPSAAFNAVNEAASVANSMQSMTVAHVKNEELNNDPQVPVVRHSLSQVESTQKDPDLQRVMDQVRVNTEPSREDHLLKCLIKSQMADHPQQWDDHSADIRYFISSFKYYQGDFETLFKVSQGYDRYFIVLSESEYQSWQTYGWIRSPRVSDELSSPQPQEQVYHTIHMFNRIGDAINHMYGNPWSQVHPVRRAQWSPVALLRCKNRSLIVFRVSLVMSVHLPFLTRGLWQQGSLPGTSTRMD